jgi:hypothetical protein
MRAPGAFSTATWLDTVPYAFRLGILAGGTEDLFEPFELRTVEPLGADRVRVYVRHRDFEDSS